MTPGQAISALQRNIMTKIKILSIAGLLSLLTAGCIGPKSFANALKEAGTKDKHIKMEYNGVGIRVTYESWPSSATNPPVVIIR